VVPFDIRIRAQLGGELELQELDRAKDLAADLLSRPQDFREQIGQVKQQEIYNLGHGAEAAGRYLVRRIQEIHTQRGDR
jgi:YidC/Oxa1 family membrane protein insertase